MQWRDSCDRLEALESICIWIYHNGLCIPEIHRCLVIIKSFLSVISLGLLLQDPCKYTDDKKSSGFWPDGVRSKDLLLRSKEFTNHLDATVAGFRVALINTNNLSNLFLSSEGKPPTPYQSISHNLEQNRWYCWWKKSCITWGCLKCWFYTSIKNQDLLGHPKWCRFFSIIRMMSRCPKSRPSGHRLGCGFTFPCFQQHPRKRTLDLHATTTIAIQISAHAANASEKPHHLHGPMDKHTNCRTSIY